MESIRSKIRTEVLHKTDIEIGKMQTEYEKLIAKLEETLEKKLLELRREEEEHRLLHGKYEAMYARSNAVAAERWYSISAI